MPRFRHEGVYPTAGPQHDSTDATRVFGLQRLRWDREERCSRGCGTLDCSSVDAFDRLDCRRSFRADICFGDAGETIVEKDRCGQCKGQKVVQDKKLLEVHVEKGMQHGQKITFQGEADEAVCVFE